ncbi:MAG: STT3 domain-containing protein [archaeon]
MNFLESAKKYRIDIMIVLTLFCLAFAVRTVPSDKFPNIYGFDSYWAARMTKYMITGEKPGWPVARMNDTATDFPWGRIDFRASEVGWWGLNAIAYKMLGGTSDFNYELFGAVASWMTAIAGALAIPAVYLFGRAAYSRMTGLASAVFLATSPNHLFYSIFGHTENDALGFTLFFLCLFSFVMTVKKKNWKYATMTAFFFSWLSIVWQSYAVAALLAGGTCAAYFAIALVFKKFGYYKESSERKSTRLWMIYALLAASFSGIINFAFNGSGGVASTGFPALAFSAFFCCAVETISSKEKTDKTRLMKALGASALMCAVCFAFYGTSAVTSPASYVVSSVSAQPNLLPYEQRMIETIAEQNPVAGDNFFDRINNLGGTFGISIWLALISAMLIVAKLFTMPFANKDFNYEWDVLALAFIMFSLWVLTSKSITMFFLAGAVAFGAGYFFGFAEKALKKFSKNLKGHDKTAAFALLIILMGFLFSGTLTALNASESFGYDINQEWFSTFAFLNTVPKGSVVTAWWDYGHWMNYFNGDNIRTSLDNIQDRKDIIYTVASAFTHTTNCVADASSQTISCDSTPAALEQAELESLSLLKPLGTDYILIDREIVGGSTGGKFGALTHIASNNVGCMMAFDCMPNANGDVACAVGSVNYSGNIVPAGFYFTKDQWSFLANSSWPGTAISAPVAEFSAGNVIANVSTRYFAKNEQGGGKTLYASALACGNYFFQGGASGSAPVLYAFEQRLFFGDPSLKHVTKVYDDGWNVIYKVNFDGVPDPKTFTTWTQQRSVLCTGQAKSACEKGYAT